MQSEWAVHFVADRTFNGKLLPVAARPFGPLLVHLALPGNADDGTWTITHKATGGKILSAHDFGQAELIATELQTETVLAFLTIEEFRLRRMSIKTAVEKALTRSGQAWAFDGNKFTVEPPRRIHAR